jgi:hypothetical protein
MFFSIDFMEPLTIFVLLDICHGIGQVNNNAHFEIRDQSERLWCWAIPQRARVSHRQVSESNIWPWLEADPGCANLTIASDDATNFSAVMVAAQDHHLFPRYGGVARAGKHPIDMLTGAEAKEVDVTQFQVSHVAGPGVDVEASEPYLMD